MAQNGGARPGAGRKPKAEKYARDINKAEKQIRDKLPDIVDSQIRAALGLYYEKTDDTGVTRIYTQPPDTKAATYLIDRILGKPVQKNENENDNAGEVTIKIVRDYTPA